MHVVVLSCGDLGAEVAERLGSVPGVRKVSLVTAPYRQPRRTLRRRVRHVWRTQGPLGFARILGSRIGLGRPRKSARPRPVGPGQLRVEAFDAPEAIARIHDLGADLGVLAGTYILPEAVFALPRLGSINLHSGKAPEYRGAAPAFWELYNAEREVGITIHRVTAALDAGQILRQELFALDPAPAGDPLVYLERYRREVLRPQGIRLLAETVEALAGGTAVERPQDAGRARTYRTPDRAAIRELCRRVAERRRARSA